MKISKLALAFSTTLLLVSALNSRADSLETYDADITEFKNIIMKCEETYEAEIAQMDMDYKLALIKREMDHPEESDGMRELKARYSVTDEKQANGFKETPNKYAHDAPHSLT